MSEWISSISSSIYYIQLCLQWICHNHTEESAQTALSPWTNERWVPEFQGLYTELTTDSSQTHDRFTYFSRFVIRPFLLVGAYSKLMLTRNARARGYIKYGLVLTWKDLWHIEGRFRNFQPSSTFVRGFSHERGQYVIRGLYSTSDYGSLFFHGALENGWVGRFLWYFWTEHC